MSTLIVDPGGAELVTRRTGAGEPVVFVHGSGGDLHSWNQVIEQLADGYECWTYTRRGYSPAGGVGAPHCFRDDVADLLAVIGSAGSRVHFVGGSYGATVALHTALETPVAVRSLAIFEPPLFAAGDGLRPVLTRYRDLLAQQRFAQAAHLFASQVAQVPAELLGSPPDPGVEAAAGGETVAAAVGGLRDLEAMTGDVLDLDRWGGLTMPVLLLRGELTWEPMPRTMTALASRLPAGSEQVVLGGQSHFATHTAPDLFAAQLRSFLDARRR